MVIPISQFRSLLRSLVAIGAPSAVVAVALPLAVGVAVLHWQGLALGEIARIGAVRGWSGALAVVLAVGGLRSASGRNLPGALTALGLTLLLAQGWWGVLRSFRATLELGEGEPVVGWSSVEVGQPPPQPPDLALAAAPARPGAPFHLGGNGRDLFLSLGQPVELGDGLRVTVTHWAAAPLVSVLRRNGAAEDQVLFKLHPERRPPEFVQLGLLPHRFYLSAPSSIAGALAPRDPNGPPAVPDRLRLRIQRGKLTILHREVAKDEEVRFDGRNFKYADGATWIRIEVERVAGWRLAWAGAALLLGAAIALARRRA